MAILLIFLKRVENDSFLRLEKRELRKIPIVTNFVSTNKQYVKIKLMRNKTSRCSIFFCKG